MYCAHLSVSRFAQANFYVNHRPALRGSWQLSPPDDALDCGCRETRTLAAVLLVVAAVFMAHFTGWVLKKSHNRWAGMQKRFLQLELDVCSLSYYKDDKSGGKPKGQIPLKQVWEHESKPPLILAVGRLAHPKGCACVCD